jgi:hypothetical protein
MRFVINSIACPMRRVALSRKKPPPSLPITPAELRPTPCRPRDSGPLLTPPHNLQELWAAGWHDCRLRGGAAVYCWPAYRRLPGVEHHARALSSFRTMWGWRGRRDGYGPSSELQPQGHHSLLVMKGASRAAAPAPRSHWRHPRGSDSRHPHRRHGGRSSHRASSRTADALRRPPPMASA